MEHPCFQQQFWQQNIKTSLSNQKTYGSLNYREASATVSETTSEHPRFWQQYRATEQQNIAKTTEEQENKKDNC
jgi:hypothetical protein